MADDDEEQTAAIALFVGILDLSKEDAQPFATAGFTAIEELACVPLEILLQVEGIAQERILYVRERARKCIDAGLKEGPCS